MSEKRIHIESNNGGTFIDIEQFDDECVEIEIGHDCVIVLRALLPAYVIGAFFAKHFDLSRVDELIASEFAPEFVAKILERVESR